MIILGIDPRANTFWTLKKIQLRTKSCKLTGCWWADAMRCMSLCKSGFVESLLSLLLMHRSNSLTFKSLVKNCAISTLPLSSLSLSLSLLSPLPLSFSSFLSLLHLFLSFSHLLSFLFSPSLFIHRNYIYIVILVTKP